MPVPASIADLSTTPGLNSPPGSESPSTIDDYLRTHAAFIKQVNDKTTFASSVSVTGNLSATGALTTNAIKEVGGNVGVGITPASKLHSYNAASADALLLQNGVNGGVYARFKRPNKEYYLALDIGNSGGNDFSLFDATAGATRWTTDSAGNLGLGVVPSASGATGVLFMRNNGQIAFSGPVSYLDTNVVFNSGADRYIVTGAASRITQLNGAFQFLTAPTGTAGNAITFTQVMSVDATNGLTAVGTGLTGTANGLNAGIGVNQTWQNLTASRAIGTPYTNSTGKAIDVVISVNSSGNNTLTMVVGGVNVINCPVTASSAVQSYGPITVPNGATYQVNLTAATNLYWAELR